jgi:hypothetical protein
MSGSITARVIKVRIVAAFHRVLASTTAANAQLI